MITFKLLLQLISNFPLYVTYGFKKYPLGLICLIVISLGIPILSYWNMNIDLKSLKSASKKYIFLLVLLFLGQFFVVLLLGLTVLAGEFLVISNSDLTSPYFYIEICIIAVVYEFLQWRRIKNGDFLPDDSDTDEYISEFTLPFIVSTTAIEALSNLVSLKFQKGLVSESIFIALLNDISIKFLSMPCIKHVNIIFCLLYY